MTFVFRYFYLFHPVIIFVFDFCNTPELPDKNLQEIYLQYYACYEISGTCTSDFVNYFKTNIRGLFSKDFVTKHVEYIIQNRLHSCVLCILWKDSIEMCWV